MLNTKLTAVALLSAAALASTLTADTVKVTANNTITFDFDDSTGVGVAPTVPSATHFSALYTPAGGGSQTLIPTTATISASGSSGTACCTAWPVPFWGIWRTHCAAGSMA